MLSLKLVLDNLLPLLTEIQVQVQHRLKKLM
jgi:hypothetical protein